MDATVEKFVKIMLEEDYKNWIFTFYHHPQDALTMQKIYEKIRQEACKGNCQAIETIYYLNSHKYFSSPTDDFISFVTKLPYNDIQTLYDNICHLDNQAIEFKNHILILCKLLKNKTDKLVKLGEENRLLKNHITYMPGGIGYKDAQQEFESIAKKI